MARKRKVLPKRKPHDPSENDSAKIARRKSKVRSRKNFFPTFLLTILLWTTIFYIIYSVDPFSFLAIQIFFFDLFVTLLFTFSLLLANTRRGFEVALLATLFLILRYFGVGNMVNLLLLVALIITFEYYVSSK